MRRPFIFFVERLDQLWFALVQSYHSRGRRSRWIVRTAGLALSALAVTQLVPTLADESTPPPSEVVLLPESIESDSVVVVTSDDESSSGGDNSEVLVNPDSEVTYATLETETVVTPPPIVLSGNQSISTRIPTLIKVDPRAVTALLPGVAFAGEETLLLCVRGGGLRFDGLNKGFVDDLTEEEFVSDGDLTSSLRISGNYDRVTSYLNADGGLRIWSNNGAVAGKAFAISVVALSGVSVDPDFCDQGRSQYVEVRGLGLGINTKKGDVRLN